MGDRRWAANLAAIVVGSAAIVAGCASGSDASTSTVSGSTSTSIGATTSVVAPSSVTPTTVVPTTAAPDPGSTAAPTTPAPPPSPDPTATLQQGLAGLGTSYHFATTASVDGAVVATAEGDRIGDGSRLAVTANGATVQYVVTPDGTWVREDGQDWEPLDDPPATTDPVIALTTPTSVALGGVDGANVTVRATVPATALGIPGDGDVPVDAVVANGVLTSVTYASTLGGKPAGVTATFGPPADAAPVTVPA